jgi:hypothetical protein
VIAQSPRGFSAVTALLRSSSRSLRSSPVRCRPCSQATTRCGLGWASKNLFHVIAGTSGSSSLVAKEGDDQVGVSGGWRVVDHADPFHLCPPVLPRWNPSGIVKRRWEGARHCLHWDRRRAPNHGSSDGGIPKIKSQGSDPAGHRTLRFQNRSHSRNRFPLKPLPVLHGRLFNGCLVASERLLTFPLSLATSARRDDVNASARSPSCSLGDSVESSVPLRTDATGPIQILPK